MPNELTTTNASTAWAPPQAKWVRRLVTGGGIFAVVLIAAQIVVKTVPTITDAVDLLAKLTSSFTWLAIDAGVLAAVAILLFQIFSPQGAINKLVAMQFSSFINKLTWAIIDADPLAPYYDRKKELSEQRKVYDSGFIELDGVIESFTKSRDSFASEAKQHEGRAKAANDKGLTTVFSTESYAYKGCSERAQKYAGMLGTLQPIRANIAEVQQAIDIMQQKLDMDIRLAEDDMRSAKSFNKISAAGRAILSKSDSWEQAQKAQQSIDRKYSAELGALKNLTTTVRPMLDSIDLDQATANEELLTKWKQDSQQLIEGPRAPTVQQTVGGFQGLIQ